MGKDANCLTHGISSHLKQLYQLYLTRDALADSPSLRPNQLTDGVNGLFDK